MERVERLEVTEEGVPGDRYTTGVGSWSWHRTSPLTLVSAAQVAEAARSLGVAVDPVDLRRNVVVAGGDLDGLVGRRFRIGEVLLEGERPCEPCRHLEERLALPGLKEALKGRGGLRASVLTGGWLRVGAVLEPVDAEEKIRHL